MKKIDIPLKENSYKVLVGSNLLPVISKEILKRKLSRNVLVVIDGNVDRLHGENLRNSLADLPGRVNYFRLAPGEGSKSIETLKSIYDFLLSENYGRDSLIIAAGGGVTGDISGYAAATFMRGVDYLQLPTTLLSAVDSSVGGKTGINYNGTKNIIGAFYQPVLVLSELDFLTTLPEEEMVSGLGEVLKYGLISGGSFFSFIQKNAGGLLKRDKKILEEVITRCIKIKASVVSSDEKEKGLRKILNLGHTFAHSYESTMGYSIKHGAAVIIGLACAVILSYRLELLSRKNFILLSSFLKDFNPGSNFKGLDKESLYNVMLHDKKNREGKIKFVLPLDQGNIALDCEAGKDDVIFTLDEVENFF